MTNLYRKPLFLALLSGLLFFSANSFAQVTFSGGVAPAMCVGDAAYVNLSNIVISENANADFTGIDGMNRTFRIGPTIASRFEFEPGVGTVVFGGTGAATVTASISVTATVITITISETDNTNESGLNTITISGIRVRAINAATTALLERVTPVGTITINGFVAGTDITSSSLVSNAPPSASNAGPDQTGASAVCGTSTTLNATAPTTGVGQWSFVSNPGGTGVITNVADRQSPFSGAYGTTYQLRWTVTNGVVCAASTDDVFIHFDQPPVFTDAGPAQSVCGTATTLNADAPTVGTGQWSFVSNPDGLGAISNVANRNSAFSGAQGSTYVLRWTVTNGICTPQTDDVSISFNLTAPVITVQPTPTQTVCEGSTNVTFSVTATGTGLSYQWKKNGVNIGGATSATYIIPTAATADAGTYTVQVSGTCAPSVTSTGSVLNINERPEVISVTGNQTVCEGTNVSFSVNAGVTTAPTYQWRLGGVNIPGATSSTYTITGVTTAQAGNYDVVVSGTCTPSATSSPVSVLTVNTAPVITGQPTPTQTVCEGSTNVTFSVTATGTGLSYQWKKNGVNIGGATSATYIIPTAATADAGTYTVQVSGTCAPSVTSTGSVLNINERPEVISVTGNQTVCEGTNVSFSVNAGVTTAPTYQWRLGGVNIPGATSSTYTITGVTTAQAGNYDVVVSGTCTPSATSSPVSVLTVNTAPVITVQPTPTQTVCEGSTNVTFSVTATGTGLSYQWKKNGVNIGGATSATYIIPTAATADAGTYTVQVSGTCAPSVTSTGSVLNINERPEVISVTGNQTVCEGTNVSFSVNAGVTTAPTYQWRLGGVNIPGATSSTYTITGVTTAQAGNYDVVVSGTCTPSATSSPVSVLTVNTAPVITVQPTPTQTVCEGSTNVTFSVTATGTGLSYQWKKNGVNIGGATSATYIIPTAATADAGTYTVQVSGTCAPSVTSTGSVLNINERPEVISVTGNQTVCEGTNVSFSVNAGVTTAPTYQWRLNGTPIGGATSSTYTITGVTTAQAGNYDVVVSGTCTPSATSNPVSVLTVNTAPVITGQPTPTQTVCEGSTNVTFSVTATGTGLSYQWKKNGVNIGGATSATYIIPTAATADAGTYTVQVSGTCAPSVTSTGSVLNINERPEVISVTGNQTVCEGTNVSFSVNAGVTTAPTYQWRLGGVNIPGATSSTYTITGVTTAQAGNYDVVVSGTCTPSATSSPVSVLTVNTAPVITGQPTPTQTVCEGSTNVTFSVTATGLSYQWKKNGVNIGGATSATYIIPTAATADAGTYTVQVSGTCAPSVTSTGSVLNINERPEVISVTGNQTVCEGTNVSFSVNAGVTTAPTYQWRLGGVNIPGATSSTYTITGVTTAQAGNYDVVVSGTCTPSAASSPVSVLTVNTAPVITVQPTPTQTVCEGSTNVTFSVTATGTGLSYQWKKNGVNIGGATSATYIIPTAATADAGTYTVQVSGTCAPSVTSTGSVLNINERPEVISVTGNQTVCEGTNVSFSVNAGVTTAPTYQWRLGGVNIPGATSSTYTITGVTTAQAGNYDVVVSGTCTPSATSSPVSVLTVNTAPVITGQPTPTQTVCEGSTNVTFSVTATGTGLSYQWKKNGVNIGGATSATYIIPTAATADAGTYTVQVSGTCAPSVTSTGSVLNINERPEVISVTGNQTVCEGTNVSFSVNAGVTTAPTYQWRLGGVNIPGATSSTYTITGVTTAQAGNYDVVVSGTCTPSATSSPVSVLTVNTAPVITGQPTPTQTVCEGSTNVTFSVTATGTGLSYQWKKNGVNIGGATSATYIIPTAATADAGTYTVQVSGMCAPSVTSTGSVLNINERPEVISVTGNQTVCEGTNVSFSVNAGVTTAPTYQWRLGGVNIPGATSSTYTITGVTTAQAGNYDVVVSGTCTPSAASSPVSVLTVNTAPVITVQPTPTQTVCEGSTNVTFSVTATGTGLSYQWKKNGVNIGGATSATYIIPTAATADAGTYTVQVSGTCAPSVTSTGSVLNINERPEVISVTGNQTVCEGTNVSFSVNAGVTTAPTYQWRLGGVNIPGATSSTYTITGVTTAQAGNYDVVVSGTCTPSATSSPVSVLTVNTAPVITGQPTPTQTVCEGSTNVTFSVTATGTGLSYQWKKNGVNIGGATSATYIIPTAATADAGTYTVQVSGTCAPSVTSTGSVLNINERPEVISVTGNQTVCEGTNVSFSVNAGVTTAPTYQWRLGGVNIPGATSSTYTITGVTTAQAGNYDVVVSGTCTPSATSNPVSVLTVNTNVVITSNPTDRTVCVGASVNFTGSATGTGLTYQWQVDNGTGFADIVGQTTPSYSFTALLSQNNYAYRLRVTGACGVSFTLPARLIVNPPATANAGGDGTTCQGVPFTFSNQTAPLATASNYASLQWTVAGGAGTLFNATTLSPTYYPAPGETGTVTFTLTANSLAGCTNVGDAMNLVITPAPVVEAGSDAQICQGTPTFNFGTRTTVASTANGTRLWTHNGTGSFVDATQLNPVYNIGAGDVGNVVIFTLRVTSGSPTVCSTVEDNFQLRVNPIAVVTVPANFAQCETTSFNLVGGMGGASSSATWSIVTGTGTLSVSSITGSVISATYNPVLPAERNAVLVFRLTSNDPDGSGPCTTVSQDLTVTMNESAKVNAGPDATACEYNPVPLNGTFSGSATSVTWSGGSGAAQFANPAQAVTTYALTTAEANASNLSIEFTITTNDPPGVCPAVSDKVIMTIIDRLDPATDMTITGLNAIYAENQPPATMTGFPGGGVFSGDAVSGNQFFPNIANITPLTNTVNYSVTDGFGCVSTRSQNVVVNPVTDIDFTLDGDIGDLDKKIYICANTGILPLIGNPPTNDPDAVAPTYFEFSNPAFLDVSGTDYFIDTENLPPGSYFVTYTYTNSSPATSVLTKEVIVRPAPKAVIDNTNSCETETVFFTESSYIIAPNNPGTDDIIGYNWDFDDNGNTSNSPTPSHDYSSGTYDVKLTVTTNLGCTNTATKTIRIGPKPDVNFTWSAFCKGDRTKFTDATNAGISTIINYTWDFNDGNNVSGAAGASIPPAQSNGGMTTGIFNNPNHRYSDFGQYDVTLTVETNDGCINSVTRRASILSYDTPVLTGGYTEDFESGQGSWFKTRSNDLIATDTSWVFGIPTGSKINASSSTNVWWTGQNTSILDNSTYYNNEKSAVIGPCINIADIKRPMISLDYWSDSELGSDGAVVQYSTDGGASWLSIGNDGGSGIDWYNGRALTGNPGNQPIGQFGWTGQLDGGWRSARYNLDEIPKHLRDSVIFRVAFGSNNDNSANPTVFNGFAFDNVYIGEKKRNVMVEYFTNNDSFSNDYFNTLYDEQFTVLGKDSSDFFKIQYHMANPVADDINNQNKIDPAARTALYGISQPPVGIMDGLFGNFHGVVLTGDQTKITARQIDQRALMDPRFSITLDTLTATSNSVKVNVKVTYVDTTASLAPFNSPISVQVALIEDHVTVGSLVDQRHVLRKLLLGPEGRVYNISWDIDHEEEIEEEFELNVPIGVDNDNLYLVAFVQDRLPTSKEIHQALRVKLGKKSQSLITGTDDPILAQVKGMAIYPNPATRDINFATDVELTRDYQYTIVDQRGITVMSGNLNRSLITPQQVDITNLADGAYIVMIHQGNRRLTQRKLLVLKR